MGGRFYRAAGAAATLLALVAAAAMLSGPRTSATAQDASGCGGFVRSAVPIDFSRLEVGCDCRLLYFECHLLWF